MNNRHHQFNMAHAFTTYFLFRYLHTAAVANDSFITNTFVLTAGTLIILNRTKNPFAEQTISFRLVSTIVNGFRLKHLSVRPFQDAVGRSQSDGNPGECSPRTI